MADFSLDSRINEVVEGCDRGRQLLYDHGYDVGTYFVDVLSQYQSLRDAARGGRLRDVEGLLRDLNGG